MDYSLIKSNLEKEVCPKCSEHPEISLKGDSLTFKVCCQSFKTYLKERTGELIKEQIKDDINNMFSQL